MRFVLVIAAATALALPAGVAPAVGFEAAGLEAAGSAQKAGSDVSAARKKTKKKAAPKEQYLRAVPSAPPPGAKK